MLSLIDRRPWVVVESSYGLNGHNSRVLPGLLSRREAEASAKTKNEDSPYGRVYHVSYSWEARPATAEEIDSFEAFS